MLRPRIIPCLLIQNGGLVKTVNFGSPKYVGDPLNAVRIFNEKEVDELIVIDIDATVHKREPDYALIKSLAAECRMPLCYGGGVKTVEQIQTIIGLGVEKVALSSAALADPELVSRAAEKVGSQSVVVVLDVKKSGLFRKYEVFTHNGSRGSGFGPAELAKKMQALGAGEIVINSIERDGQMKGYDVDLIDTVRAAITLPMTALGGAGSLQDVSDLIRRFGIIGAAAGSLFVFKGTYRAVLINYPNRQDKDALVLKAGQRNDSAI
ncbi:imidazole glycerol phosphate synthase subunit HisF [Janthinobacterium sp. BJB1]|nr:imidazole glycerol phosphate synthase subunit HisF [Janthinobacterium sp. BJB303]PJC97326.1 imidazole glycerol phosphate synthase subunit HisF [Janthinobacterium sp. BJB1]